MKVLCIGDAMIDVIVRMKTSINENSDTLSEISMHGGGAAANTATWLASLGVDTTFVGRVGSDVAGANILSELRRFNVKHHQDVISESSTGTVVVLVDRQGNRTMFPDSGANSGLSEQDLPDLAGFEGAFLSGYSLFNPASTAGVLRIIKSLHDHNIPIFFDVASVGTMESLGKERSLELISGFSGLFMNDDEAKYLTGTEDSDSQIDELESLADLIVIKRGALGARAKLRGNVLIEMPAIPAQVVDTTGAGDSFAAGFLSQWLAKRDLAASLMKGLQISAVCVATIGARPRVNP